MNLNISNNDILPDDNWASLDSFILSYNWKPGINRISLDSGNSLDVFFSATLFDQESGLSIPVFFSGALTHRENTLPPYFSGARMSAALKTPYVAFSDPTLNLDEKLPLGWYPGAGNDGIQNTITRILREIVFRTNRHLLLIGGSGGGFAALYFANRVGAMASAFVWNPQTDLLDYDPKTVTEYLHVALSSEDTLDIALPNSSGNWKNEARGLLKARGIESEIAAVECSRVFYLQNATDWHVRKHLVPFIERAEYIYSGNGLYVNNNNHCIVISNFGVGHAVPPNEMILGIINAMLTPVRSVRRIYNELVANSIIPNAFRGLPHDLRNEWTRGEIVGPTEISMRRDGYLVSCPHKRYPGYGGLTADITGFKAGAVVVRAPMNKEFVFQTSIHDVDYFSIRFQDGFGNILGTVEVVPKRGRETPCKPLKVFLFGSCVSRDAFQLDSAPPLVDYVARSSLSSALSEPAVGWRDADLSANPSAFQRRVIQIDLQKGFRNLLINSEYDCLLMDFIDERLRTVSFDDGSITYSPELQRAGFSLPVGDVVKFGSKEYFSKFESAFSELLSIVPESKIVINKVYWASVDSIGDQIDWTESISEANSHLERIYSFISRWPNIRFIEYDRENIVADMDHKWGLSPFHFIHSFYEETIAKLSAVSSDSKSGI